MGLRGKVQDVYSPSTSQADICQTALFTKSFTGRKQGLSSPNPAPLQICVKTREIWAKFFLDSTSIVEETMSKVSGVLREMVHRNSGYFKSGASHDGGVDGPVVNQPTEARRVFFFGGMRKFLPERS